MSGSSMKDRLKNASSTFAHTAHARDPVMWNCRRLNEIRGAIGRLEGDSILDDIKRDRRRDMP